jgi:hypothetical protein
MHASLDPAELTPDERFRELARLLAVGLLRLKFPVVPGDPPPHSATQKFANSSSNHLDVSREKSVTVHAG